MIINKKIAIQNLQTIFSWLDKYYTDTNHKNLGCLIFKNI